jgi:HD superfamily phosphohydrolase/predicted Ser/Thr protein kinase
MKRTLIGAEIAGRYKVIEYLGEGGASEVYKVRQIGLNVDRALKVLRPRDDADVKTGVFVETFKNEVGLLSTLSHRHLTKILDFGEEEISGETVSFYVMELANGTDLNKSSGFNSATEALRCFGQILEVLEYLHKRSILHFDIKPANILVHNDPTLGEPEYKVTDLGVAKIVNLVPEIIQSGVKSSREETYVYGTQVYAPPYAQRLINKTKSPVMRTEIQGWLPHYDLYALGLTMAETLLTEDANIKDANIIGNKHQFRSLLEDSKNYGPALRQLPEDQLRYLIEYILLLLEPFPQRFIFKSTREAREAFERMDPRRSLPLQVPEITSIGSRYLINKSNLTARLSERAFRIVSHPSFQRLQRLNQLNLVELFYPDARQSRLSHSVETFELAKEVACHLLGDELFRLHVGGHDLGLFLCAALLHDIGHYPLTHAVEDLRLEEDIKALKPQSDMDTANYFLNLRPKPDEPSISDVLRDGWGIEFDEIIKVIGRGTEGLPISSSLFRQLLDGPAIDIDKLAYLSKDSFFTGAAYGKGIDIQSLISSLVVLKTAKNEGAPQIGLLDKGVRAAESMIIARYHMFSRVYWHHTNRAVMSMIRYVMRRVFNYRFETEGFEFGTYLEETINMSDMEALKMLSDKFDSIQKDKGAGAVPNPVSGLLNNSRVIYKRLCSFSNHPTEPKISSCYDFLNKKDKQMLESIRQASIEILSTKIRETIPDSYVLIDVPQIDKRRDFNPEIFVKDYRAGSAAIQLKEVSNLVKAISNDFEGQVKKSRIFIHPTIREKLRSRSSESAAAAEVEGMIFELWKDHA